MEFTIKRVGKYFSVRVTIDGTRVDMGLLDKDEAEKLRQVLISVAEELIDDE